MPLLKGKIILVIDDAEDVCVIVKGILETDGATVLNAKSIEEGFGQIKKSVPHLVLLDLQLPGRSGFDLFSLLKEMNGFHDIPMVIIILSAKRDRANILKAVKLGAADYVIKPIRASVLLRKVRQTLKVAPSLAKKFSPHQRPKTRVSVPAEISKINEVACQIKTSVKLSPKKPIHITSTILEKLDLQNLLMQTAEREGDPLTSGRYLNEVRFLGIGEKIAKSVRKVIKDFA
jgi:DNA-binding response OmpR family regulator